MYNNYKAKNNFNIIIFNSGREVNSKKNSFFIGMTIDMSILYRQSLHLRS